MTCEFGQAGGQAEQEQRRLLERQAAIGTGEVAAGKSRGIEVQTIASEVQNVCSGTRAVLARPAYVQFRATLSPAAIHGVGLT